MPRDAGDLLYGTLDLLVLRALATEPMHGFALSRWIDQRTNGELGVVDSALYKALHRLEDAKAVLAEWGASENNRRAKYYSLSPRGRQMLRSEIATWKRYVATVSAVLEPG
ncbi:MAG: PadR family transcriptional regulator [Gemmatimonadota bacterium]